MEDGRNTDDDNSDNDDDDEEPQVEEMPMLPLDNDDYNDESDSRDAMTTSSASLDDEPPSYPLPRDHSYLSGASHPLLVSDQESSGPSIAELAILELDGVVLFPGSTLPVKLRDPVLIAYLGHQIEVCRTLPHRQPKVCIGIVTYEYRRSLDASRPQRQQQQHRHHLLNRIGTIATIQYTQERTDQVEESQHHHVWRRYQEMTELVFTAVGTGRFQIIAPASNGSGVYQIRELKDIPLLEPRIGRLVSTRPFRNESKQHWRLDRHDQVTWNLSMLTPIPYFVYERNWPWKLKDELIQLLQENKGRSQLPQLESSNGQDESSSIPNLAPTQFSYWLSSNMPFTQKERLELLEMTSTLERLRELREKVLELVQQQDVCYLACTRCDHPLAMVGQIFSFDGAEGATSNCGRLIDDVVPKQSKNSSRAIS